MTSRTLRLEILEPTSFDDPGAAPLDGYDQDSLEIFLRDGNLSEWLSSFLTHSPSRNINLLRYINKDARYLLGPFQMKINQLKRIAGPGAQYPVEPAVWETRIDRICTSLKDPRRLPPGIIYCRDVSDDTGKHPMYQLADGAHRHEALKRLGCKRMCIIAWMKTESQLVKLLRNLSGDNK